LAVAANPITSEQFDRMMSGFAPALAGEKFLAVAVSGGGDSMALAALLSGWCAARGISLLALTVDHGLRPESGKEARQVAKWVKAFGLKHRILNWEGEKPKTRIQEKAREARYDLMAQACRKAKITYLFLAHHGDDQMETFLFRLAKGSGLDGLSGMSALQHMEDFGIVLARPLLQVTHADLIATCEAHNIPWAEDPSNQKPEYARVRLRTARSVLVSEGLTPGRLAVTAARLGRAASAIDQLTEKQYKNCTENIDPKRIEINFFKLKSEPEEIVLRILKKSIEGVTGGRGPALRLQRLEALTARILTDPSFKGATIGGAAFRLYPARLGGEGVLVVTPEAFGSP
jgi:tRNA(Ile)-lysidine synthase